MMVARRRCISRDSSGFTAAVWPVHGRSRYRRMMELRLMLQIMSPFVAHLRHAEMSAPWLLLEGKRTLPSVDCKPLQQVPKEPDGPVKERNRVTVTNSLRASYAGRAFLFCRGSAR